ncbi:MAG: efflux RND transporter periplasmic adaptor subunit, partial [Bacteroidota bacterium]|nr:efflux RND transporter periplasmic adaptor subunit [Bacteroidota bacterium]
MKIKYFVYALLIIGFASLVVYRISANKKAEGPGGPGAGGRGPGGPGGAGGGRGGMMQVDGIVVKPREFANNLAVTGSIEANEEVQIRGQVSGLIRSISFKEGSNVKAGQVLLKIDDAELRAQLAQAQTRQSLAAENAERAAQLFKKEAISREEYDIATADYKTLQSQTQLIQAQLAKTTITAPFSGRIGLRNVSVGDYLTPETIVANLVSSDPVKITFSVPEKYASQVKVNTKLKLTVAGSSKEY